MLSFNLCVLVIVSSNSSAKSRSEKILLWSACSLGLSKIENIFPISSRRPKPPRVFRSPLDCTSTSPPTLERALNWPAVVVMDKLKKTSLSSMIVTASKLSRPAWWAPVRTTGSEIVWHSDRAIHGWTCEIVKQTVNRKFDYGIYPKHFKIVIIRTVDELVALVVDVRVLL